MTLSLESELHRDPWPSDSPRPFDVLRLCLMEYRLKGSRETCVTKIMMYTLYLHYLHACRGDNPRLCNSPSAVIVVVVAERSETSTSHYALCTAAVCCAKK